LDSGKPAGQNNSRWRLFLVCFTIVVGIAAVMFTRTAMDSSRVRVDSPQELSSYFNEIGYSARLLRTGNASIPKLTMASVPRNWAEGLTVDRKKTLFFRALLPMVMIANSEISMDRTRLLDLRNTLAETGKISSRDTIWIQKKSDQYGLQLIAQGSEAKTVNQLLPRVDIIPPSLALAQGAVESAYASSRFAVEGNALFGQWKFGDGLVPGEQRTALGDYRIAVFDSPLDSIRSYMRNLNTNRAYSSFRELRADARKRGEIPRGSPLAAGLLAYSEKGQAYVSLIRSMIARNGLSATDGAKLRNMQTVRITTGPL